MMNAGTQKNAWNAAGHRPTSFCIQYSAFCTWFLLNDGEHVIFAHDHDFFAVDLELGAGVAGEEDFVALLDGERDLLAVLEPAAVADGEDLAALGLFFGAVGQNDAALGL